MTISGLICVKLNTIRTKLHLHRITFPQFWVNEVGQNGTRRGTPLKMAKNVVKYDMHSELRFKRVQWYPK